MGLIGQLSTGKSVGIVLSWSDWAEIVKQALASVTAQAHGDCCPESSLHAGDELHEPHIERELKLARLMTFPRADLPKVFRLHQTDHVDFRHEGRREQGGRTRQTEEGEE